MKNPKLKKLINELKKASIESDVKIWKRIASDLEKSARSSVVVNLYKLDKFTKDNEVVIVPGKVLGTGELNHPLTIAAYSFSKSALQKLSGKSKAYTIEEFLAKAPKGEKTRIIG